MEERNPVRPGHPGGQQQPADTLNDIKQIMERSSRFISLSGLSGIAAGVCALAGAFVANGMFKNYYGEYNSRGFFSGDPYSLLKLKLLGLAFAVFAAAFLSSFYFTWRRAKKQHVPVWGHTSKRLAINMIVPLVAGAGFVLGMLRYDDWSYVAPACLVFYGLALVNASKYTLSDVRYLGYCEILVGFTNLYFIGYGLYFWAIGFGVLHIIYGIVMWFKYEREN